MKVIVICTLLILSCTTKSVSALSQTRKQIILRMGDKQDRIRAKWRAATYKGLKVGASTRKEMLRILGNPQWAGYPSDQAKNDPQPEVWNEYTKGVEFSGKLSVVTDKRSGVILRIHLYPENLMKGDAIKHFGTKYVMVRYDFDSQLTKDEEASPLCKSSNGVIETIEYPAKGIAVKISDNGKVNDINYLSKPLATSKCKSK